MQVTKITDKPMTKPITKRKPLTEEELQREYNYFRSIKILQKMLNQGLITQEEFHKTDRLNRLSFLPSSAPLMP